MKFNPVNVSCYCLLAVITFPCVNGKVSVISVEKLELIEHASATLCNFQTKTIHVYFENESYRGYSGEVPRKLSDCGVSCIILRNHIRKTQLKRINDDGILMYLLMVLHDPSQYFNYSILRKRSAAKHLSHVLLIITKSDGITEKWLRNTFTKFWQIWFLNIAIMFWRDNQLHIYRYNPFAEDILIKVASSETFPRLDELFPKKLPDMRQHPMRMCMFHDDTRAIFAGGRIFGSDGFMSDYVAERLNAVRVVHRVSSYGNYSLKTDICLREVAQGIDDVAFNIRFLAIPSFIKHVEYTIVHGRDDLCVLVPKARTTITFWNLFRSFDATVWFPILLSIPIAYAFCVVMYRRRSQSEFVLLQLFASTLSMPLTHIPSRLSLRLFLFCWLFYGMLICNAFKGNLTSNLVFRTHLKDINTIKDLALSPYDLLTFPRHTKHLNQFLNISDPYEAMIKRKMTVVPDEVLLSKIEENNVSYAYLQKYHVAIFQANARRHTHFGRPLYHVMSTCLVPFHAVYIVPFGSPYLGFVNSLVRSSHEHGLTIFWDRVMVAAFIKWMRQLFRQRSYDDPIVLKLAHFQAAFGLLFMGLTMAFLIFLWEILRQKCFKLLEQLRGNSLNP